MPNDFGTAPVAAITASYTEWLTWQLPFTLDDKRHYINRGTLYVEMVPDSETYSAFKPIHSTIHDGDQFKHTNEVVSTHTRQDFPLSEKGRFIGINDPCVSHLLT